jgi:hypothetical protein
MSTSGRRRQDAVWSMSVDARSASERREVARRLPAIVGLTILWLAALEFCLRSLDLKNDQFGRISPGWQILTFGELPFRDFLDPGYFLTEFSSAAVQWLLGRNLLGELLLNSLFIASGCVCVGLLTRRLTNRVLPSLAAGVLALVAMPRAYDYDKALFYPLGLLVASRWLERPTRGRAFTLAMTLVIAAMYRYDNGVFLGIATLVGALILWWGEWRRFAVASGALAALVAALSVPVLLFLQVNGGIADAADQALTYGVREGARTRIDSLPRVRIGRLWGVAVSPPSANYIRIRWAASVASADQRHQLASDLGLHDEQAVGDPADRTWRYTLPDPSLTSVRRVVNHPSVEDTDGIDRGRLQLTETESWLLRLQRISPVFRIRFLPGSWTDANAAALLYYLLIGLTAAGAVMLMLERAAMTRVERAQVVTVLALSSLLCVFILRSPVSARVGGMAGPICIAGAWMLSSLTRRATWVGLVTSTVVVLLACWSLDVGVGWYRQLAVPFAHPRPVVARLRAFAQVPPLLDLLPSGHLRGMVEYVGTCTAPDDRIFASWFIPELYYFAQRGFGGAVVASFGGHWSEARFQRRTIAAFEAHPTPIVLIRDAAYDKFRAEYPLVVAYLDDRYMSAATTDFGDSGAESEIYRVLIRRDRQATSTAGPFGLPCFVAASSL